MKYCEFNSERVINNLENYKYVLADERNRLNIVIDRNLDTTHIEKRQKNDIELIIAEIEVDVLDLKRFRFKNYEKG